MDSSSAGSNELTASLEAALARELLAAWHQLNEAHFRAGLTAPTIELVTTRSTLGRWLSATRTLEISRSLVIEKPWGAVVEVLKHEMAHQYVDEILCEHGQTAHGPAFRAACEKLGFDARAAGLPDAQPGDGRDRIVERIARLLALAGSPNRHEAEAAMAAAQKLMLKHNLDAAAGSAARAYEFLHLGDPTGRIAEHERIVAMILGEHFFVESIWVSVYRPRLGKRASVLEVCGRRENVATAEYVHGFLHATAGRLWQEHKEKSGIVSNRERRSYLAGVMVGFADTLERQKAKHRSEGLVWVRDGDLHSYFRRRHPYVRHVRHAGEQRNDAWAHGREAGRGIVLHRPVEPGATARGRLLTAKA